MESTITEHKHTGIDSPKINFKDILTSPLGPLTSQDGSSLTSGGTGSLTTSDANIISQMRIRINEIEAVLKSLNLLK